MFCCLYFTVRVFGVWRSVHRIHLNSTLGVFFNRLAVQPFDGAIIVIGIIVQVVGTDSYRLCPVSKCTRKHRSLTLAARRGWLRGHAFIHLMRTGCGSAKRDYTGIGFGGQSSALVGGTQASVRVHGIEFDVFFFVTDSKESDLILGRPWHQAARLVIWNEDDGSLFLRVYRPGTKTSVEFGIEVPKLLDSLSERRRRPLKALRG